MSLPHVECSGEALVSLASRKLFFLVLNLTLQYTWVKILEIPKLTIRKPLGFKGPGSNLNIGKASY